MITKRVRHLVLLSAATASLASCASQTSPTGAAVGTSSPPSSSIVEPATRPRDRTATIAVAGLFPEGLAYDPVHERFLIGSLWNGSVAIVGADGSLTPFADAPGRHVTGLRVDAERNRVLVAVAGLPGGEAKLSIHDLSTGRQTALVDFGELTPPDALFANDVAIGPDGTAYVTNTDSGVIWAVSVSGTPSILLDDPALGPSGGVRGGGLNGIEHVDGALIVGHGGTGTLHRVPLGDPTDHVPIGVDTPLEAIDGVRLGEDGRLAVVSNNGYVQLLTSIDGWSTARAASRHETGPVFPTSVAYGDGRFYVLEAHLDRMPDTTVDRFRIALVSEEP